MTGEIVRFSPTSLNDDGEYNIQGGVTSSYQIILCVGLDSRSWLLCAQVDLAMWVLAFAYIGPRQNPLCTLTIFVLIIR